MQKIILFIILIFSNDSFANVASDNESLSALKTIDNFYKKYLNYNYHETPHIPAPKLGLSKSFKSAIQKNTEVCKNYATGICGWAADMDEYLNTQETDPLLNYENSRIALREISKNIIEVKLNVYPSATEDVEYYNRVITFAMIEEGGEWVADDINSSRERMEKENAYYMKNPDPDSIMAKK